MSGLSRGSFDTLLRGARGLVKEFAVAGEDPEVVRRVHLLVVLSLVGIINLVPLGVLSLIQGNHPLGYSDLTLALVLTVNLVHARLFKRYSFNITVGVIFTALLYVFAFASGGVGHSGFVWYFTFPLIASYLLGSGRGAAAALMMLVPVVALFVQGDLPPFLASYSTNFKIRFIPAYIVVLVFSYLFERTRERSQAELGTKNRDLERTVLRLNEKEEALRGAHRLLEKRVRERTEDLSEANRMLEEEIAEKELAERELEFMNIILATQQEMSLDGVLVVNEMGKIVSFNKRFCEIWGIGQEVLASGSDEKALAAVLDLLADPEGFLARVKFLYDNPDERSREEVLLKDGRVLDRYSSPMLGPGRRNYGRVWYFRDITREKRVEEDLREGEERYRTLISQASDSIFLLDPDCDGDPVIVEVNQRACEDHGYTSEELIGRPISDLDDPVSARLVRERAKEISSGKTLSFEVKHVRKDGSTFPVEVSARIVTIRGKNYILSFDRDITKRKAAEDALRKAKETLESQNDELKKLDRMKDALMSDVSHELKTPVAKHVMQLEVVRALVSKSSLSADMSGALEVMESSIRRQQSAIRNILMMSRLESGPRQLEFHDLRLDRILEEVARDFTDIFSSHGIKVNIDLEPVSVRADRDMLWHVFSNIFSNAIKYRCVETPTIQLSVRARNGHAVVRVSDNGVGMTPNEREKAFERFFQASPSVEGIGLGLNISRVIMERLGGRIRVSSEGRDCGATVVTDLPLIPAAGQGT